jgi:hypothetical protein
MYANLHLLKKKNLILAAVYWCTGTYRYLYTHKYLRGEIFGSPTFEYAVAFKNLLLIFSNNQKTHMIHAEHNNNA